MSSGNLHIERDGPIGYVVLDNPGATQRHQRRHVARLSGVAR